jgi:putative transposase
MSLRLEFVQEALLGREPFAAVCARHGISEKTGYKWRARFLAEGPAGLADRSHVPHHCPQRLAPELAALACAARRRHPTWGARKLLVELAAQYPDHAWPAPSTLTAALRRAGLIAAAPRRRRIPARSGGGALTRAQAPNDVWSTDFKGEFRTQDGHYCYPLTVLDGASRYLLTCQARPHIRTTETRATFEGLFRTYGLPHVIRSDNGVPFASVGLRGLSTLNVWWLRLGIWPERIRRGCPQENGVHERMHRTLKAEATIPAAASGRAQQRRFDAFRAEYNTVRPHEALGQVPPAARYAPSPRPYPARLPEVAYPAGYEIRRVTASGCFRWHSEAIFLTKSLAGETVGLTCLAAEEWVVYFGPLCLGLFTPRLGTVIELEQCPVFSVSSVSDL